MIDEKTFLDSVKEGRECINNWDSPALHLLALALMQEAIEKNDIQFLKDNYAIYYNQWLRFNDAISNRNLAIAQRVSEGEQFDKVFTEELLKPLQGS